MTEEQLRAILRTELTPIKEQIALVKDQVAKVQTHVDGLPLLNRSLTVTQQEVRSLRAAFNDFARTNVTAGEIEALHADVNRVQAESTELSTRLATVERLLNELRTRP
jgi:prefoldin subunit 5